MSHRDLLDFCKFHKKLYCYGAGNYARTVGEFLLEQGIPLNGFLVTRCEDDKMLLGLPVYSAGRILCDNEEKNVIIGVSEKYHSEIKRVLKKYGINQYFQITTECFKDIDSHTRYEKCWNNGGNNICVLLYHRVCNQTLGAWSLAIAPEIFEKHINFYKEHYDIIRFDDDWTKVKKPSVVITFDDGYADNLYCALPILEKYDAPATIFVSTGNLGTNREFWWDELERIIFFHGEGKNEIYFKGDKLQLNSFNEQKEACRRLRLYIKSMVPEERNKFLQNLSIELNSEKSPRVVNRSLSEDELRVLSKSTCINIGGHTVSHNMLSVESEEQQEMEIFESKKVIESIINRKLKVFSYPFGSKNDFGLNTINILRKAGYLRAGTTIPGTVSMDTNCMMIPRNGVPFYEEEEDLARYMRKIFNM